MSSYAQDLASTSRVEARCRVKAVSYNRIITELGKAANKPPHFCAGIDIFADEDLDAIVAWLRAEGLVVDSTTALLSWLNEGIAVDRQLVGPPCRVTVAWGVGGRGASPGSGTRAAAAQCHGSPGSRCRPAST